MTTPTADTDRLQAIRDILRGWAEYDTLTDAEALAKVRALLSEGEPGSLDGPPDRHPLTLAAFAKVQELVGGVYEDSLAVAMALMDEGEPPKVRDESREDLMRGVDKLRGQLERAIGEARRRASVGGNISLSLAEHLAVLANAALEKLAGYAPQGAPPEEAK